MMFTGAGAPGGIRMWRSLAGLAAAMIAGQANAAPLAAWVQMTGRGAEVRAIVETAQCPSLNVDGAAKAMRQRAGPDAAFANRICQARLPAGARKASLDGQPLPLPKARPMRLVILGDSGCRLKGAVVQDCNDPVAGWPFAKVAHLAAAQKPDLVIHVGDYYYRETPCPEGDKRCTGSPYGDRWGSWKAELFDPASPLLAAAPWVFARGNHEDCQRGGKGWFRLLDADDAVRACPASSDTFLVPIGGAVLGVVDSADPDDTTPQPTTATAFGAALKPLSAAKAPVWIVTHRPVWEIYRDGDRLFDEGQNVNERTAVKAGGLAGVALIVAGHEHTFFSLDAAPGRPAELIVGTGGDRLDSNTAASIATAQLSIDGGAPAATFGMSRFGYYVFDRKGEAWEGAFHDLTDKVVARCRLAGGRLTCQAA
jgi:hypothetical protein